MPASPSSRRTAGSFPGSSTNARRHASSASLPTMSKAPVLRELTAAGSACRRRAQLTRAEPGGVAQRVRLVGALPREVVVVAAEVTVRGGLGVDRAPQVEVAED